MNTRRAVLAAASCLLWSHTGFAQATSIATARQLANQGIDAVEAGDCDKGAPLLERAEQLHHASVHLQYLARCRAKSGRLVAATEMWRRIVRDGAPDGASPAVVSALTEAQEQLSRTLPRLASTTIRTADSYPGLVLAIDGTPVPADMVGTPQVLDPGDHELRVTATGYQPWSRRFNLAESGTAEIRISLTAVAEGSAVPVAPEEPAHSESQSRSGPPPWLAPTGWVTASVGAASLIAGTVTLLARNNRRSDLESKCPNETCKPADFSESKLESEKSSIRDLTTASNVLFWGGGALLAGGATLIVLAGRSSSKEPSTALVVGAPRATAGLTLQGHW
jgi:hypothetical protein